MKNEELYPEYLTYLDNRLLESKISKGEYFLLKMSRTSFDSFRIKLENEDDFYGRIMKLHTSETRDKKIDDIFDDINF